MKRRHVCGIECYKVKGKALYHACKKCKHGTETRVTLTPGQKECATRFVPAMVREFKQGRWASRQQAIAVGLSKARQECR